MKKIILRRKREASLKRFHPWVFSGAIYKMEGQPEDGELVRIVSAEDVYLGTGYYQRGSIAVRLLSFQDEEINLDFWVDRIQRAWTYRKKVGILDLPGTNCYRFVERNEARLSRCPAQGPSPWGNSAGRGARLLALLLLGRRRCPPHGVGGFCRAWGPLAQSPLLRRTPWRKACRSLRVRLAPRRTTRRPQNAAPPG